MYLKKLPLTIVIGSIITSVSAAEIKHPQFMLHTDQSPEAIAAYWTPERLQTAVPMDMPRVDANYLREISREEWAKKSAGKPTVGKDGAPPVINIDPDMRQLFIPLDQATLGKKSLNVGSTGEQFTSSRLVPTTADQVYPYRAVGKIFFSSPSGNRTCSASVIGNRIVLTAGHCLHNGNNSNTGWSMNISFIPAYNTGAAPYQSWTTTAITVPNPWYAGGGTIPNSQDYGMIEIADKTINGTLQPIANIVGKLGWQINSTIPNHAHIIGYSNGFDSGNLMHQVTSQSAKAVDANNVEYGSDLNVGAGGSPWIQNFGVASTGETGGANPGTNRVIGVSSYAYNDTTSLANGGPIFDNNFMGLLTFICNHKAGNC